MHRATWSPALSNRDFTINKTSEKPVNHDSDPSMQFHKPFLGRSVISKSRLISIIVCRSIKRTIRIHLFPALSLVNIHTMSSKSAAAIKAHAQKKNTINQNKRNNKVPPVASIDKTLPDSDDVQKRYVYRDFSNVVDEGDTGEIYQEGLLQALTYSTTLASAQVLKQQQYCLTPPPIVRASCFVRSQRFPVKLYALLNEPNLSQVISWMPHGRSWKVLKPRIFETAVLPIFFESNDYHSFNRVVNAWSFRRKSTGPDRGSYFHELFLRGKPHLQEQMRRLPRTHKKIAMEKKDEPDFYELEKVSPLPTLKDSAELERLQSQRRVAAT